jgi:hypothetical protein
MGMITTRSGTSEVAIFSRILEAEDVDLSPAGAQALLELRFAESDQNRMRDLSAKAKEGTSTVEEQEAINNYEKVGHILSLMKSKARRATQIWQ